jgi:eukaryotic-like serine/threonine-protein kinase
MESIPVGPFLLQRPIGQGGMGEVWRGVHGEQGVQVAVKVLTREAARRADYVASFHNEIASIARLIHPSIVVVLEYGELSAEAERLSGNRMVAGSPFIVMEYARHGSLYDYQAAMRWPELRAVLFTVLDALSHAHARGVVHRDLKPQNILLGGDRDAIKLTDFGLAHLLDEERPGEVETGWGTPHYMAPEQFRGAWRDYGPWTDLYALGVMAFELASGQLPFDGQSTWDFGRAHITQPVPRLVPRFEVPPELERWVLRLLQKDPARRFQRAADAAVALSRIEHSFDAARLHARRLFSLSGGLSSAGLDAEQSSGAAMTERAGSVATPEAGAPVMAATLPLMDWAELDAEIPLPDESGLTPLGGGAPSLPSTWRRHHTPTSALALEGAGLGLYGLREVRLVGRERELDLLWEQLRGALEAGKPRVVLLEGQVGIGKSRLAEWLCDRVHELGGGTPLRASHSAQPQPGDGEIAMCLRALRLGGLTQPQLGERLRSVLTRLGMDEEARDGLVRLLGGDGQRVAQGQRHGLLRSFFEALAAERPLVIWLDDVHHSVEALMLARRLVLTASARLPALLILTSREDLVLSDSLEALLIDELCAQPGVERVRVDPLEATPFAELVEDLLGLEPTLARQVFERAGGVPLFAVQLVGDWVARGRLVARPGGFALRAGESPDIPDDLHQLWQGRLDRFFMGRADTDRGALEVAAALGARVTSVEWLLAAQFRGVLVSQALVPSLFDAGLALPGEQGWSFAHGMLRESLERGMRERGAWEPAHRACASMLEALGGVAGRREHERLAHHLIEAGAREEAIWPLREATLLRLERSELTLAGRLLERQEALLGQLGAGQEDARWGLCWELRARVLDMQGRSLEAVRWAKQARDAGRAHGWRDVVLLATLTGAEASLHRGGTDAAARGFEEARLMLGARHEDTPLFVRAEMGLARVAERHGELGLASELFLGALEAAEELGDELVCAACLNGLGDVARRDERWEQARAYAERALVLARGRGNKLLEADCLNDLAELSRLLGRPDDAVPLCAQAARLYELVGSAQRLRVLMNLGFVQLTRHRYAEAREVLAPLVEQFASAQEHSQLALAIAGMVPCYAAEREWDAVGAAAGQARRLLAQTGRRDADVGLAARLALRILRAESGPAALIDELERLARDFAEA